MVYGERHLMGFILCGMYENRSFYTVKFVIKKYILRVVMN